MEEKFYDSDGIVITGEKVSSPEVTRNLSDISSVYVNGNETTILSHVPVLLGTIVVALLTLAFALFHGYIFGYAYRNLTVGGFLLVVAGIYGVYNIKYPTFTLYIESKKDVARFSLFTHPDKNRVDMLGEILKDAMNNSKA